MFIGYHRERVSESQTKTIKKTSNNTAERGLMKERIW